MTTVKSLATAVSKAETAEADALAAKDTADAALADARLALMEAESALANDGQAAITNARLAELEHQIRFAELRAQAAEQRLDTARATLRDARISHAHAELEAFYDTRIGAMREHYTALVDHVRALRDAMVSWQTDAGPMKRAWHALEDTELDARIDDLPQFPAGSRDHSGHWFTSAVTEGQVGYLAGMDWAAGGVNKIQPHILHTSAAVEAMQRRFDAAQSGEAQPVVYGPTQARIR